MSAKREAVKGMATDEQIRVWKQKFGEVNQVIVKGHAAYLKPLDRNSLAYALSMIEVRPGKEQQKIDLGRLAKMGEVVMQNCWIDGSEDIKKNDRLWVSVCIVAGELVEFEEAELKKL